MSKANDTQVGANHYREESPEFQHWDWVAREKLDYFQGQITRYVARHKRKDHMEDLLKAEHFIKKYIELYETGVLCYVSEAPTEFEHTEVGITYTHEKDCDCDPCIHNRKVLQRASNFSGQKTICPEDPETWTGIENNNEGEATSDYVDQDK